MGDRDGPVGTDEAIGEAEVDSPAEDEAKNAIAQAISLFLERVYTVESGGRIFIPTAAGVVGKFAKKLVEEVQDATALTESDDPEDQVLGSRRLTDAVRRHTNLSLARVPSVLERALFLSLFAYYDAFTGQLLKAIYGKKPEMLRAIDREYKASDVIRFSSMDDLKDAVLDDEVETLRRKSYADQFKTLEGRFGIGLREFSAWPAFVECSQRRNLFTHADGVVSDQYLRVCADHGSEVAEGLKTGEQLGIGPDYFFATCAVMLEVGLKLGQVLWRKACPEELEDADAHLHNAQYSLLEREKWELAVTVGEFFQSLPKISSESIRCLSIVNHAIALTANGQDDKAKELIGKQDWSAAVVDFVLAQHVLMDRWQDAADTMRVIGPEGKYVGETAYHNWPLFRDFRNSEEFRAAYEEVYGYPFYEEQKEEAKIVEQQEEELLEDSTEGMGDLVDSTTDGNGA